MTLCIKTGAHCCCQPDEGAFCPDYKPDWYVQCLMDAITALRHDLDRAMANHNADINSPQYVLGEEKCIHGEGCPICSDTRFYMKGKE